MNNILFHVQNALFFLISISLPITTFLYPPKVFLGDMSNRLSIWFVILALLVWFVDLFKNNKTILFPDNFKIWMLTFWILTLLSFIYNIQYIDYVYLDNSKLDIILKHFSLTNYFEYSTLAKAIRFLSVIKTILSNFLFTFGTSLWIFNLYHDDYKRGIKLFVVSMVFVMVAFIIYAVPETMYLANTGSGIEFLKRVNPILYPVASSFGWWPPLLWPNQMRLLFPEPSNIGLFMGAIIPCAFLALLSLKKTNRLYGAFFIIAYSYFVFMSQARTSYVLLVFAVILFICLLFVKRENINNLFRTVLITFFCVAIGFSGFFAVHNGILSDFFIEPFIQIGLKNDTLKSTKQEAKGVKENNSSNKALVKQTVTNDTLKSTKQEAKGVKKNNSSNKVLVKQTVTNDTLKSTKREAKGVKKNNSSNKVLVKQTVTKVIDNNLLSVASGNKRSNAARYGVIKSELLMAADHWLLGVGRENTKYYFEDYMPEENLKSGEIRMWIKQMRDNQWKSSYPCLNEYTRRFSEDVNFA